SQKTQEEEVVYLNIDLLGIQTSITNNYKYKGYKSKPKVFQSPKRRDLSTISEILELCYTLEILKENDDIKQELKEKKLKYISGINKPKIRNAKLKHMSLIKNPWKRILKKSR
ncbi:25198_t:CDS:1, partial [Gigaspora rosea]